MAYEKVMGRPHSTIRKQRLLKAETKLRGKHGSPIIKRRPRAVISSASSTEEDQKFDYSPTTSRDSKRITVVPLSAKTSLCRGTSPKRYRIIVVMLLWPTKSLVPFLAAAVLES